MVELDKNLTYTRMKILIEIIEKRLSSMSLADTLPLFTELKNGNSPE